MKELQYEVTETGGIWNIENKEFMKLHKEWLSITWDGVKVSLNDKLKLVVENIEHTNDNIVQTLFKKSTLDKIKESVEKRFRTSYKDIALKIITYYSKNNLRPLYNNYNDYDSYDNMLRICVEREINKYKRVYGG